MSIRCTSMVYITLWLNVIIFRRSAAEIWGGGGGQVYILHVALNVISWFAIAVSYELICYLLAAL